MSKSQELSHARHIQSIKKKRKSREKENSKQKRSLSLESKNFIYRTFNVQTKKRSSTKRRKKTDQEINKPINRTVI